MADTNSFGNGISDNGSDGLEEKLGRLSKKTGVKATIALDRLSGAILKTSGQVSSIQPSRVTNAAANTTSQGQGPVSFATETSNESQGFEQLAALVWGFVSAAGTLVQDIDTDDELKLLRLRTKKHELVIVPDTKYLMVVIHDTPAA